MNPNNRQRRANLRLTLPAAQQISLTRHIRLLRNTSSRGRSQPGSVDGASQNCASNACPASRHSQRRQGLALTGLRRGQSLPRPVYSLFRSRTFFTVFIYHVRGRERQFAFIFRPRRQCALDLVARASCSSGVFSRWRK